MAMRAHEDDQPTDDELIARHIELPAGYHTADRARLTDYGVSVPAIIYTLQGEGADVNTAVEAYGVSVEAVHAAIAYYERHKEVIDARITLNVASWSD